MEEIEMRFRRRRIVKRLALGLAVAAIAAPTAQAQFPAGPQESDLLAGRSALATVNGGDWSFYSTSRPSGTAVVPDGSGRALAGQAGRQYANAIASAAPEQLAAAFGTPSPQPSYVRGIAVRQSPTTATGGGFDQDDAIGLGVLAGVALLAGGTALVLRHRSTPALGV
jgi:hypothetical protein